MTGFCYHGNNGIAFRRIPTSQNDGFEEKRKFRYDPQTETVFFLGHQSKITKPMQL